MIIFGNILGSIFWGAVIALAATGIVWMLCRLISGSVRSLGAYIVLTVLFLLAGAQGSMLTGSLYIRGYVADAGETIQALMPTIEAGNIEQTTASFDDLRKQLLKEYPMFAPYADKIDLSTIRTAYEQGKDVPTAVAGSVTSQIDDALFYYALRRLLWLLGFMVAATLAIVFFFSYRSSSSGMDYGGFGSSASGGAGTLQF